MTTEDTGELVARASGRRVTLHGRIIRADGRVEELGLLGGTNEDGTPMTPDPRPTGIEYTAAMAFVEDALRRWVDSSYLSPVARRIVDDLFRYGPVVPDGTQGARTSIPGGG